MAIPDWPASERPREKLLKKGAKSLSDIELLAIFLRTGIAGKSAVDLARDLLVKFGSLAKLFAADQNAFCQLPGLGVAKFAQLQAVLEMAQRALKDELSNGDALQSPDVVRNYLHLSLKNKEREIFIAIFLDARNRTIASEEMFQGTLTQSSVYPREIIKQALHYNAAAIIFAHNHPSGAAEPSQADIKLTQTLKKALALVDVKVLDHFIIARNTTLSFAEAGLI